MYWAHYEHWPDFSPAKSESVTGTGTQRAWLDKALEIYGPTLGQGVKVPTGTVEERLAPLTPTQTQATDVQGFLDQFAPYRDMPMFGETGTALAGILSGTTGAKPYTPEAIERYKEKVIADPRRTAFETYEAPGYREEYAGPGYWGSARAGKVSEKRKEMEEWIGTKGEEFTWDVEEANRAIEEAKAGRALGAIQPAMDYTKLPTEEATARLAGRGDVLALAGVEQQQRQAELNTARQILSEQYAISDPEDLDILMSLLGMGYSSASAKGAGLGYAALTSFLGGFGGGAGEAAGASIFG